MIHRRPLVLAECVVIVAILLSPAFPLRLLAEEDHYDCEGVLAEVYQACDLYDKGKYRKARAMVEKLNHKVFDKSDSGGLEYPTSVTLNIKYLDKLLKDKEGYFDELPSFTGIAKVEYAGNTGAFEVKGKKKTMAFGYERDVLFDGDFDFDGRRITVYYEDMDSDPYPTALKIVVHPQGRR